jgi:hypothetical protein
VSITGQNNGFQATKGVGSGGSAFFHNWNNQAAIKIQNTNFDEAGFLSSFNLLNITSAINGSALIAGNTFRRTAHQNVRWEGNRLENVDATLSGNTFSDGSYLDLYGKVGSIKIDGFTTTANTFNTIAGGYGIRMTDALTGTPTITGSNVFAGGGLALKFVKATAGSTSLTTSGTFNVNSFTCSNLFAGGQASDTIAGNATANNWISGDTGNDNLTGGTGDDAFVFATALNASTNVDTITNFTNSSGQADKICLAKSVFTGLSPGSLNAGDFDITWPTPNTVGRFRRVGFCFIGSGKIKVTFSAESVTQGALANAGTLIPSNSLPLGYVDLVCTNTLGYFKTAGSATNVIENAQIYRFAQGAGGGGAFTTYITQNVVNGSTIDIDLFASNQYRRVQGSGGPVTTSNTPFGTTPPADGTTIRIVGMNDINTVTIPYWPSANGFKLNGTATLKEDDVLTVAYDAVKLVYVEISRNF